MKTFQGAAGRIELGVVANEFFDPALGRAAGGLGWAARQVARLFNERPSLDVEVFDRTGGAGIA